MNEALSLAAALLVGSVLGAFFFAGLWWTVRKALASERVALWFLVSMLIRTSLVLLGFYFFLGDDWKKLVAGLLGFVSARLIVMRLTRSAQPPGPSPWKAGHAP